MRLLVSVRSPMEVEAAVAGGADIIDAKEPLGGSIGAVDAAALAAIAAAVPHEWPFSIALGDVAAPGMMPGAMDLIRVIGDRPAELYVKVGLAGVAEPTLARAVLEAAVDAARRAPLQPEVVAVAYADHGMAGSVSPKILLDEAAAAGVRGVLLDTWSKDGHPLFAWTGTSQVSGWLEKARERGLLTALAGSLSLDHVDVVNRMAPDVFGVRGAACVGGRAGRVSAALVQLLAEAKSRPTRCVESPDANLYSVVA